MSILAAYSNYKFDGEYGLDGFKKGWFADQGPLGGGHAHAIRVDKILYQGKSKFQDMIMFQSKAFGRVLVLDGDVQVSEFDEFSYHEMMAFLNLNSHPNPKKVLVIGGGDGGVVREVAKHPLVESVILCELDEKVIEVAKKYLPTMAKGFDSPKLKICFENGAEYIKHHQNEFDVIITDSPDPKAPAICLFQKPFYEDLKKALKPGGIIAQQGPSFWFDRPLVKEMIELLRSLFPVVEYASSYIACYPAGTIGYVCCSTDPNTNFREPIHKFSDEMLEKMELQYYTTDVHRGAFSLPLFAAREFGQKWRS